MRKATATNRRCFILAALSLCLILSGCGHQTTPVQKSEVEEAQEAVSTPAESTGVAAVIEDAGEEASSDEKADAASSRRKIVDVEYENPPEGQYVESEVTFVLDDGTKIAKPYDLFTQKIKDVLYLDITGDGEDETVLQIEFGNTAGYWDLVEIYQMQGDELVQILNTDHITEIGSQMLNVHILPCGIRGLPPYMLDVTGVTKAGAMAFEIVREVIVWQNGRFECVEGYEIPPKERFEEWTVNYQAEQLGAAINRMIYDGMSYDATVPESVWTALYYAICDFHDPLQHRLDFQSDYEGEDGPTYTVSSACVHAYASALFKGLKELPEIPDGIDVSYDADRDTYVFIREKGRVATSSSDSKQVQVDGSSFTLNVSSGDDYNDPVLMTLNYLFEENPNEAGSHLFPYAIAEVSDAQ